MVENRSYDDRPYQGSDEADSIEFRFSRRALLVTFSFWTLFGVLQASNWVSPSAITGFGSIAPALGSALLNAYIWALLTPRIFRLASGINPAQGPRVRRALRALLIGLGIAAGITVVVMIAHEQFFPRPRNTQFRVRAGTRWYFQEFVTFIVVFGAGVVTDISRRYRLREKESSRLQAQAAQLEIQLAEARLEVLQARLNPHFLFNTLNAVSALVAKDPEGVRNMIALLSELLRYSLKDATQHEIPIEEELRLLRRYLEIMEIRYQGQLTASVNLAPGASEALVPSLILQPIVENAIKHGVDRAGGIGSVDIDVSRDGDDLVITVRNTGPLDDTPGLTTEGGVGLSLTRDRLAGFYGSGQEMVLLPRPDGGMVARIVLPFHTRSDVRIAALEQ